MMLCSTVNILFYNHFPFKSMLQEKSTCQTHAPLGAHSKRPCNRAGTSYKNSYPHMSVLWALHRQFEHAVKYLNSRGTQWKSTSGRILHVTSRITIISWDQFIGIVKTVINQLYDNNCSNNGPNRLIVHIMFCTSVSPVLTVPRKFDQPSHYLAIFHNLARRNL